MSVNELLQKVRETQHHGYPVLENGKLAGVVSWHDTRHIPLDKRDEVKVGEIMTRNVISLFPKDQAREALDLLDKYKIGRVIV
ncbi:MAG: CBS domain-containing protein, partial [Actinomycetota bacterium]